MELFMSNPSPQFRRSKATLETLRFFTTVATSVMGRPLSPAHTDAIAHYAARKLPSRTLSRLGSKTGGIAALQFIVRTLEHPQLSR
jgi:hypothetical protein